MNIGRVLNSLLAQERIGKADQERPQERYARIVIPLDNADYVGTDIELHLKGDYIGRIKYDGSATGCYFKLNNRHSGRIYAGEFRRTYSEYDRIYFTNPSSQSGKQLVLTVGGAFSSEIEPSSGGKTGLQDSGGTDIDPAEKDEYDAALLLATNSLGIMDDWDETNRCKVNLPTATETKVTAIKDALEWAGTPYVKSVVSPDVASVAAFEASTKKLRSVVIKNTHASYEAMIGDSSSQVFQLAASASLALDNVDLALLYHKAEVDGENPTLHLIGTEEA